MRTWVHVKQAGINYFTYNSNAYQLYTTWLFCFQSFYSSKFSADEERVSKLFTEADSLGITVQQRYTMYSSLSLINIDLQF